MVRGHLINEIQALSYRDLCGTCLIFTSSIRIGLDIVCQLCIRVFIHQCLFYDVCVSMCRDEIIRSDGDVPTDVK